MNNITYGNEWERKFIRENWTFPFGSLMQAYAQIHQGKDLTTEQIKKDAAVLFDAALEMTAQALLISQQTNENKGPEVPLK